MLEITPQTINMRLRQYGWMNLGTQLIFKSDGKPFKTRRSAEGSSRFNAESSVIDYSNGFALISGSRMSKEETAEYLKHYVPYKASSQVYAEGVYEKSECHGL